MRRPPRSTRFPYTTLSRSRPQTQWPEGWESVEERRQRRLDLGGRNFNVYSKATLGNTRAVVRYLARYTSRIAMSNARIAGVDTESREVRFLWKDYRDGGRVTERTLPGKTFIRLFTRHLVPKGYRRIRYFGWLTGGSSALDCLPGKRPGKIDERAMPKKPPACEGCKGTEWNYLTFFSPISRSEVNAKSLRERFSLVLPRAGP